MSLRVLANASSARLGGGLSFIVQELAALEEACPDVDLDVVAAPWNASELKAALRSPVHTAAVSSAGGRFVYEQLVIPFPSGHDRSVLYYPANFVPLGPWRAPVVLTLQNPNYFGPAKLLPHNRSLLERAKHALSRASVRRADHVVAISESLRNEVLRDLPAAARKMTVIQSGAPTWPEQEKPPGQSAPAVGSYFLSVANDYPHKRLDALIEGWTAAFRDVIDRPRLVLVGDVTQERRQAQRALAGRLVTDLIHAGPITDRGELRWWVENALAMVTVSALEAHPLTPAEAGALGCPLILSDIPPHREVAGGHATYVPVRDPSALPAALSRIHAKPQTRTAWYWPITWHDHARRLVAVLTGVASAARQSA